MAHEDLGEHELARGELGVLSADLGFAGEQVQSHASRFEDRLFDGAVVAQAGSDPSEQLREAERLGDVVVGATLEAGDGVPDTLSGREDDHRQSLSPAAHLTQDLVAVHPRQAEIEDHQVEVVVSGGVGGHPTILDHERGKTRRLEPLAEEGGDAGLVFGDEKPAHGVTLIGGSIGSISVNVLPTPTADSNSTLPPCASAMLLTIASPSPAPPLERRPFSPLEKRSNRRSRSAGGMPGPASRTQIQTVLPNTRLPTDTGVPSGVCSRALRIRFITA